jgi:hypothetical protein
VSAAHRGAWEHEEFFNLLTNAADSHRQKHSSLRPSRQTLNEVARNPVPEARPVWVIARAQLPRRDLFDELFSTRH